MSISYSFSSPGISDIGVGRETKIVQYRIMKTQDTWSCVFISLLKKQERSSKSLHMVIINLLRESCFSNFLIGKEVKNTYDNLI